jgi:hypothetical protein
MKLWTHSLQNTARRSSGRHRAGPRNISRFACVEALESRWAFAAHVAFDMAQRFDADGRPTQAYTDYLLSTLTTTGTDEIAAFVDAPTFEEVPALSAQSSSLIRLNSFRADPRFAGIDGRGFSSVIIDSGIDLNHPFFGPDTDGNGIADRIVFQHDFADGDGDASDRDGHGSNVSGIVASASQQFPGMAPGSNIIHLKVFSDFGGGASFADMEAALQWVVANAGAFNIASVNLSIGSGNASSPAATPLNDEYAALANLSVITTVAAGNSFFAFASAPGVNTLASSPNVLAVSATWDGNFGSVEFGDGATDFTTGPDRVTSFSQRHPTLTTVFAPGAFITNASHTGGTVSMAGTSQAAPHVAGVATLMQQLAVEQLGRRLTFAEFKSLLRTTGPVIVDGDDENDNVDNTEMSGRRLDVMSLAEAIVGTAPPAGDRFEANETFATAANLGTLGTRSEANLSIHTPGDDDVYRFTASATGEFTARVSFSHAAGDIDAALFDVNGNQIASSDSITDNEVLTADVIAEQTYFLHVFGFDGAVNPNYTLELQSAGGGGATPPVAVVNGRLLIQGTAAADVVSITGTGVSAQYTVSAFGQTQVVSGVLADIIVDLGGGDDSLVMNNAFVNGRIEINVGSGRDRVVLGDNSVVSTVTDLIVQLGDGDDLLDGKRLFMGRDQSIDAGAGNDELLFQGFFAPAFTLGTSAARNIAVHLGDGNDRCDVVYGFVRGGWTIDGGLSSDQVSVFGSACSGLVTIAGGGGADRLAIDTNFFNADLRIDGGSGNDELLLANGLGTQRATVAGGDNADSLIVRNQTAVQLAIEGGPANDSGDVQGARVDLLFAQLGDGDDELAISSSIVRRQADLDGGLGFDALIDIGNLFASARASRGFESLG